jgi:hypothetical protein
VPVVSDRTGFAVRIDLETIQRAVAAARTPCEVVLDVSIGSYVGYGDRIAEVRTADGGGQGPDRVAAATRAAVHLERQRTIDAVDAVYGLEQLETVGWTSISGAQHNPHAARLVVRALRDVLARVAASEDGPAGTPDTGIVYRDTFPEMLMEAVESLAVITADSQQHQIAADIIEGMASLLPRLSPAYRERTIAVLMRTLPALTSPPPTTTLEAALTGLQETLEDLGEDDAARVVATGLDHFRARIGAVTEGYTPR